MAGWWDDNGPGQRQGQDGSPPGYAAPPPGGYSAGGWRPGDPWPPSTPAPNGASYGPNPGQIIYAPGGGGTVGPGPQGPGSTITPPTGSTGGALGSFTAGMSDDQVRALANQYIEKGGARNIDNGQYWVDAYHRMDPGYLQSRLQQGVSDQAGYNGAFGAAHQTPGGNSGGGTNPANLDLSYFSKPPDPFGEQYTTPQAGNPGVYQAPTAVTMQNDPGYQFRLDEGNKAMGQSAAAQGSVLSGGTQKAIADYNQQYASNEFGNVVNRAQQAYGTQQNAYQASVGNYANQYAARYGAYQGNVTNTRNFYDDYMNNMQQTANRGYQAASNYGQGL
jgi:hypothetical protein